MLRKTGPARALDPNHRPEGSKALGTRMPGSLRFLSFLVPLQVLNHRYLSHTSRLGDGLLLSLTSLSSTPLHYEVQLEFTSRQITFILLDSFKCIKDLHFNLLIHLFNACFTLHENMHRMSSLSLAPW